MTETLLKLISFGGLILHACIFIALVFYYTGFKKEVVNILGKRGMLLAFLLSLGAMMGSLYFSEVAQLEPCILCWYQRIFSYSSVFLLGFALIKKDNNIIPYVIFLNFIGGIIASYHVLIEGEGNDTLFCGLTEGVSCTETYYVHFGYITIPILSLTIFISTLLLLFLKDKYVKNS